MEVMGVQVVVTWSEMMGLFFGVPIVLFCVVIYFSNWIYFKITGKKFIG